MSVIEQTVPIQIAEGRTAGPILSVKRFPGERLVERIGCPHADLGVGVLQHHEAADRIGLAASAADVESGLPPNVVPWLPGVRASAIASLVSIAPIGMPLPSAFASVITSVQGGRTDMGISAFGDFVERDGHRLLATAYEEALGRN